jgi:hypothetical protein
MSGESHVSLLFGEVLFIWHAANYLLSADPIRTGRRVSHSRATRNRIAWFVLRAVAAAVLTAIIPGSPAGIWLAGVMLAGCVLLPASRWLWVPSRYLAELEVSVNVGFAAIVQILITQFDMQARGRLSTLRGMENSIPAYLVAAALLIYAVRGGTFIVRGVLDRAGTMPPPEFTTRRVSL